MNRLSRSKWRRRRPTRAAPVVAELLPLLGFSKCLAIKVRVRATIKISGKHFATAVAAAAVAFVRSSGKHLRTGSSNGAAWMFRFGFCRAIRRSTASGKASIAAAAMICREPRP